MVVNFWGLDKAQSTSVETPSNKARECAGNARVARVRSWCKYDFLGVSMIMDTLSNL
jgi:hypothetical protein